ncbi:stage V sporulation protein AB [Alkaliphilus metalliredigens QYMF]|uniref:Stage V sporulation protein AB n=1 Tax=Alkaliphilus metalliredigens (strain QYMF) TaxID=293826 RepID=A6TQA7_ALKMQ|nr:stage V sporulation protein AB [Alkaliphilus metalliredigens]ABR48375.1 stage V sporulation protein AB [Alkaliphilus metalliredigens QYMF]
MGSLFLPIIGFANGIIVGSGIVALLTLLDIIPRLGQLTKTYQSTSLYESIIILGATFGAFTSLTKVGFSMGPITIVIVGFTVGTFIGLLASALAEVMNVIPVLIRRFRLDGYILYVVYSLIFGKVIGSLIHWLMVY